MTAPPAASADRPVDLIETMAFDPEAGIARIERHLARMKASSLALGFGFDRHAARNELQAATFRLRRAAAIRLALSPSGAVAIEVSPPPAPLAEPVAVAIVPLPLPEGDRRPAHPTGDRRFYDAARAAAGTAEVVFERPDGRLTGGSFTTLFVEPAGEPKGPLRTPPLADGVMPGVLRGELIDNGQAVEAPLTRADLIEGFLLGNALRGLFRARLAVAQPEDER